MLRFLRRLISPSPAVHRKRTCLLRLECLESREVPSIPARSFDGDLMKGGIYSFPAQAKDLPSGTTIEVRFGGSADPKIAYQASVTLKAPTGAAVASKSPVRLATTPQLLFKYVIQTKTSGKFAVDVKNAGPVAPNDGVVPYSGTAAIKLPDIAVTSAKYIGGSEKEHKNPTGVSATYTITKDLKEKFKIGLYRSADGRTPTGAALKEVDVTGDGAAGAKSITLDTKNELKGTDAEPFLVIVADKDKMVEEDNEGNNSSKLDLPKIGLKIEGGNNGLTLMDQEKFTITSGSAKGSGHRIEVRQQGESDNEYVAVALTGSAPAFTVIPRLAEQVEYLASIVLSGARFYASPTKATVQFPEIETIAADAKVKESLDKAWNRSIVFLRSTGGQKWREYGAQILLDTSTGTYSLGPVFEGQPFGFETYATGSRVRAEVAIPRLDDVVDRAKKTGVYWVSLFHTHPDDMWRAPKGHNGPVGPSDVDRAMAADRGEPGLVYDYIGQKVFRQFGGVKIFFQGIPAGWDPDSTAVVTPYGPTRRRI